IAAASEDASGSAGRTESTSTTRSSAGRRPFLFRAWLRTPARRKRNMRQLPQRPDLDQLRRQARELHRAAATGDSRAVGRLRALAKSQTLTAAQLAVAREYGFPSWVRLNAEVDRRRALPSRPEVRTWQGMRDWSAQLLHRRTGKDVDAWNRRIARRRFRDQAALRNG